MAFKESIESLRLIFPVIRHGERAPLFFAPSDPNKNYWPNGEGSLTNVGKLQAYNIGRYLRQTYNNFLGDEYRKDDIYVRSTDTDRSLMTAQCCLAGLYPPTGKDIWSEGLPWQPIPVHCIPGNNDPLHVTIPKIIKPPPQGYPKESQKKAFKIFQDNKDMIEAVAGDTKAKGNTGLTLVLLETYFIEKKAALPAYLPTKLDLDDKQIRQIVQPIFKLMCQTGKSIVMGSVHLLNDIVTKAQSKIVGELQTQKVYLYSLHDIIIIGTLTAFADDAALPAYGAILLFELHKHPQRDEYFIKIIYHSQNEDGPVVIQNNGSNLIPFKEFRQTIADFTEHSQIWISQPSSYDYIF